MSVGTTGHRWDAVQPGWLRWFDRFERGGVPVTARLLDLAQVGPGKVVLDVGTGLGEPALTAARHVRPGGLVVGVDLAETMIAAARRRAPTLENVILLDRAVEDLQCPPGTFDVVLSRWCLMFLPDLRETLRTLHALLKPGGTLAAAVWGPPATTPIVGLATRVLTEQLDLGTEPPGQPGTFRLSDSRTCRAVLLDAGFTEVEVEIATAPFWLETEADYVRFTWDVLPPSARMMVTEWCGSGERSRIRRALRAAAAAHRDRNGRIQLPSTVLCLKART
jgi:SAM-dependent methyltransferase